MVVASAPKTLTDSLTPEASDFLARLNTALNSGNSDDLCDIVFDAEQIEEVAHQIDLQWYE